MADGLRKGLASYGDAGFSLFLRKAFIKAMGYSDDALNRPIVGITNTYSDYNPCHGNVPQIIEAVKRGVMLTGAMPMVFPTISIAESFSHPTSMYLRNLMAMDTEEMIRAQPMDAVVVIGGCDKTLPAQIMAAVSADLPTVVIPVGPMVVGHHKGEVLGACTDCRRLWGKYRAGEIDDVEIEAVNGRLAPSVGTCMVMGTASTMACITEALGLSLPMSATIPAPHAERFRSAEASGKVAAAMAKAKGPRAERIPDASVVPQRAGGAAGDRRLDQRADPSDGDRPSFAAQDRPRDVRQARPRGAGADRPEAVGRALHGAFPSCRRRAEADGATRRPHRSRCQDHHRSNAARRRRRRGRRAGAGCHPSARQPDQVRRRDGGAARQSRAARGRHQAIGGEPQAAAAYRPRGGVRIRRGHDAAGRRSRARRQCRRRAGAAQRRPQGRARHAGGGLSADPEEARARRRQGHGADLGCAHERHGVRHHRAAYHAGVRRRRAAGAGEERRHDPARCREAQHRSAGR